MYATIQKWGGSQGIRIPKHLLTTMGLRENDKVELEQKDDTITIRRANTLRHKTLEERMTEYYGVPMDQIPPEHKEELDWGGPVGNEVW